MCKMCKEKIYIDGQEKAKTHNMFYHYTNLESLRYILKSQAIQLTEIRHLNDMQEGNRIDEIQNGKVFIACFCHDVFESIPLWNIYAKGEMGFKIRIL